MLHEVELTTKVLLPSKDLKSDGSTCEETVLARRLLKLLLHLKLTKEHGYFLTLTKLKRVDKAEEASGFPNYVYVPASFTCRTLMPCVGETMLGVVHRVYELGVFLRHGPMKAIFLARRKMRDYQSFISGKNAAFQNEENSRIEVGVVVRFTMLDFRWREGSSKTRDFLALATMEGESLGPVSLSGSDELAL